MDDIRKVIAEMRGRMTGPPMPSPVNGVEMFEWADRIEAALSRPVGGDWVSDVIGFLGELELVGNTKAATLARQVRRASAPTPPSGDDARSWERKYRYALTLIDAAADDGDGMAGIAFSAQVPHDLIGGKSPSQIAELLCDDAITTKQGAG